MRKVNFIHEFLRIYCRLFKSDSWFSIHTDSCIVRFWSCPNYICINQILSFWKILKVQMEVRKWTSSLRRNVFIIQNRSWSHLFCYYHCCYPITFLLFSPIKSSYIWLWKWYHNISLTNLKLKKFGLIFFVSILVVKVMRIIINLADICHTKIINKIFP